VVTGVCGHVHDGVSTEEEATSRLRIGWNGLQHTVTRFNLSRVYYIINLTIPYSKTLLPA